MSRKIAVILLICASAIFINLSTAFAKTNTGKSYIVDFDFNSSEFVPFSTTYEVTSVGLKIRNKPGIKGKVIGYLKKGDLVTEDGGGEEKVKDGCTWIHISRQSDRLGGWVAKEYLREFG